MSPAERRSTALVLSLYLAASGVTAVAAVVVALARSPRPRDVGPPPIAVTAPVAPAEPIRAEAQVFRTTPAMLALEPGARRERSAHPRTLATARFLRAYPGAPPRIPHAVTPEEFRTDACRTCHERGGFSLRFAAYVPVTPHPERGICLQCHAGEDSLLGVPVPIADPNARCPQCHGPEGGPPRANATLTWSTTVWPRLPPLVEGRAPPGIPHDLQFRENCVACHSGPAAVAEIRTSHAERANCRQCHLVLEPDAPPFSPQPLPGATAAGGAR